MEPKSDSSLVLFQYEVLRCIFSKLSADDLENCAKVCTQWEEIVDLTINTRKKIQVTMNNVRRDDTEGAFLLCEAELVLCMTCMNLKKLYEPYDFSRDSARCLSSRAVTYRLPKENQLSTLCEDRELNIRFPLASDICARTGFLSGKHLMKSSEIEEAMDVPAEFPIKCIILLVYAHTYITNSNIANFFEALQSRGLDIAVSGCQVEDRKIRSGARFVIFAGNAVDAASCILDENCLSKDDVTQRLLALKASLTLDHNTILFGFRCVERRPRAAEEEDAALAKYFPDCNVFVTYGHGEYGIDHMPSENGLPNEKKSRIDLNNISLAFSTSYLCVRYKI